jgi:hypothetical protein
LSRDGDDLVFSTGAHTVNGRNQAAHSSGELLVRPHAEHVPALRDVAD